MRKNHSKDLDECEKTHNEDHIHFYFWTGTLAN